MQTGLSVLIETLQRWTVQCCGLVPQEAIEPQAGVGLGRGLLESRGGCLVGAGHAYCHPQEWAEG